jgi:hypothetical protein
MRLQNYRKAPYAIQAYSARVHVDLAPQCLPDGQRALPVFTVHTVPSAAGKLKTRLIGRPASATRTAATTGDMRIAELKVNRVHGSKGNPCEDTKIAKIWAERGL